MVFRANESMINGYESVKNYFIPTTLKGDERDRSKQKLDEIISKYGPVISSYPTWHPLVSNHDSRFPVTIPNQSCGYKGLDHTRFFVNAFVTCPYGDGQEVIDSVEKFVCSNFATVEAERLDIKFYNPNCTPILVSCNWEKKNSIGNMIPASVAIPMMLLKEVPCCEWSSVAETWQTMRPYFLGVPHGSRSSLFLDQETCLTMKNIWNMLINTGMFGPIFVSNQKS